jgi:hypothetical protein
MVSAVAVWFGQVPRSYVADFIVVREKVVSHMDACLGV